jgi:3-hydroxyisobutyrate dehydrogenase-like beta-hydroxyacid dehydrogenase
MPTTREPSVMPGTATTPSPKPTPVTVIGLGSMGHALAEAFSSAGHPTTVWNRSAHKAAALVDAGATLAPAVADAVAASPLVILCVLDTPTALGLLEEARDALPGTVVVNLTTGTPDDARRIGRWVADHGGDYLDGAIMAVPAMIGSPEAMVLYSGSRPAFDSHESTLRVLTASSPFIGEDAGSAESYDVAMLALLYSNMVGWLHAYALVGAGGIDASTFQPYAQSWFTNVVAAVDSREVAGHVDSGSYPDTTGSSLALNAMGLALTARASTEAGINTDMFDGFARLAAQRVADGHGADGFSSLIETIKRPETETTA